MIYNKKITVVGCGTLGSFFAYKLALSSIQNDIHIERLYLIDNDSLDDGNLPYLTLTKLDSKERNLLGKSKAIILASLLHRISPNLDIRALYKTYPLEGNHEIYETLMIDCRDTSNCDEKFFMKINIDGKYASIKLRPRQIETDESTRYSFGNSRYYADLLSTICCYILFHLELPDDIQQEYLLNFEMKGDFGVWFNNFIRKNKKF